jgi:kinesin family protein 18/19
VIFQKLIEKNLKDVIEGKNFFLIGYGYSNSGKTHTLIGTENNEGILLRTTNWLDVKQIEYTVSFFEFFENSVFDLISSKELYK